MTDLPVSVERPQNDSGRCDIGCISYCFNRTMEYSGSAETAALETSMLHRDRRITVLGIQKKKRETFT